MSLLTRYRVFLDAVNNLHAEQAVACMQPWQSSQWRQQAAAMQQHARYSTDDTPQQAGQKLDPFTRSLQEKTEQEVLELLQQMKQNQQQAQEDEEDDLVDVMNPETGEMYGPRGKEPTRFGDWEVKGRCTDFS
eukprot:GHRR01004825.1.p1 GENE.GHRR01004825.1~~GHRR01004825.1.p1  ORF type:complete len:133 (+),score=41.20 GHRR01004825.1:187-585(+)